MGQDLLAPPKVTTRKFAWIAGAVALVLAAVGAVLVVTGAFSVAELAWRTLGLGVLVVVAAWAHGWLTRVAQRERPERMPWIHATMGVLAFAVFYGGGAMMLRGTMLAAAVSQNLWTIPGIFGMTLAMGGVARRVGESLHCPRCEYEFAFEGVAEPPVRCPECGSGWLGMLRKGRRVKSPRMIGMGAAITVLSFLLFNPMFWLGSVAGLMPTPVLWTALYAAPMGSLGAWDELSSRTLTEGQIRAMGERVLGRREGEQVLFAGSKWFTDAMAAGKMPPDLAERFYREGLRAELVVPRRVKVGERFEVKLRVRHVASDFGAHVGVILAGYGVDGGELTGRQDQTVWGYTLSPGFFSASQDALPCVLVLERKGPARVRVVYWVHYQAGFWDDFKWQADGTPSTPTGALYFKRVEMEAEVVGE